MSDPAKGRACPNCEQTAILKSVTWAYTRENHLYQVLARYECPECYGWFTIITYLAKE